jgi:signal transduction histidine kinase/FixJ family two-component response regulator
VYSTDSSIRIDLIADAQVVDHPVFASVWRAGEPLEFLTPETPSPEGPLAHRFRWAVGLPVTVGGRRHGVLVLGDSRPRTTPLREADLVILRLVGRCFGNSLERQEHATKLDQVVSQAEWATKVKGRFLALLSHEIRNPLNGILGFVEHLRTTPLTETQREAVQSIGESGSALVRMLGEILEYSNLERGEASLSSGPVDLRSLTESVVLAHANLALERGVELIWAVDPSVPNWMETDEARLRQVLDGLMAQAMRTTFEGLVHITLGVVESSEEGDNVLTLLGSVRDTGLGMDPVAVTHLLQPLEVPEGSPAGFGYGMGLAICRRICHLLGGDLEVRSESGQGTLFSFHVRSKLGTNPGTEGWQETPSLGWFEPLAGRSVLVVAETRELRHMLTTLMLSWKMNVINLADLRALPDASPVPDVLVACEEDLWAQGGFGILRERLGSIPLVTVHRATRDADTPTAGWTEDEDSALSGQRLIRVPRPLTRKALHQAVQTAVESGLMDSAHPLFPNGQPESVANRYPLRILLVEDHPTNQRVAQLLLSNLGYQVDQATHGQAAVDAVVALAENPERAYQLVLMDLHLPGLDGLDATRAIRQWFQTQPGSDSPYPAPYISALTADALSGDREICLAAGMDDYLTKPLTLDGLRKLVKRAYRSLRDQVRQGIE